MIPATLIPPQIPHVQTTVMVVGDQSYEPTNRVWLKKHYARFRQELFSKGMTEADPKFDCSKFTQYYCALAQVTYYTDTWSKGPKAQALAVGELWYKRSGSPHAVIVAILEEGAILIEPQTGLEVRLSEAERASVYYVRF